MASLQKYSQEAAELAWAANAYLDSAIILCEQFLSDDSDRSTHHNRVPLHLAYLSLELFYKAGIAAHMSSYPRHHDLVKLQQSYAELYPDLKIDMPSYIRALVPETIDMFNDAEKSTLPIHFTRFRYYSDKKGRPFPPLELADFKQLLIELNEMHIIGLRLMGQLWCYD